MGTDTPPLGVSPEQKRFHFLAKYGVSPRMKVDFHWAQPQRRSKEPNSSSFLIRSPSLCSNWSSPS